MKSDSSPERDHAHDGDLTKDSEVTDGNKKRKRKPYRPGEEDEGQKTDLLLRAQVNSLHGCFCPHVHLCVCLRYWGVHGAPAWGEGRSK